MHGSLFLCVLQVGPGLEVRALLCACVCVHQGVADGGWVCRVWMWIFRDTPGRGCVSVCELGTGEGCVRKRCVGAEEGGCVRAEWGSRRAWCVHLHPEELRE